MEVVILLTAIENGKVHHWPSERLSTNSTIVNVRLRRLYSAEKFENSKVLETQIRLNPNRPSTYKSRAANSIHYLLQIATVHRAPLSRAYLRVSGWLALSSPRLSNV